MVLRTVAIISIGEMGQSVAIVLRDHGLRVVTCLQGRSSATVDRAAAAGVEALASMEQVAIESDIVLSITHSGSAVHVATQVAEAIAPSSKILPYVDLNSIAPDTSRTIRSIIERAGGVYIDGSIIGAATNVSRATFYLSGPDVGAAKALEGYGLRLEVLGDHVGQASLFKVLYAGMTKGITALMLELLLGARSAGLLEPLCQRYRQSHPGLMDFVDDFLPNTMARAGRRSQEMKELSQALAGQGIEPLMAHAAQARLEELAELDMDGDHMRSAPEAINAIYLRMHQTRLPVMRLRAPEAAR